MPKRDSYARRAHGHGRSAGIRRDRNTSATLWAMANHEEDVREGMNGRIAVVLLMGMVLLAALAAYAISTPPDRRSGSSSGVNEHRLGPAVLSGDTDWNFPNDVVRLRGDITTNGHSLSILAARLHSDGARIGGWRPDAPGGDGEGGEPGRSQGAIVVDAREHEGSLDSG